MIALHIAVNGRSLVQTFSAEEIGSILNAAMEHYENTGMSPSDKQASQTLWQLLETPFGTAGTLAAWLHKQGTR